MIKKILTMKLINNYSNNSKSEIDLIKDQNPHWHLKDQNPHWQLKDQHSHWHMKDQHPHWHQFRSQLSCDDLLIEKFAHLRQNNFSHLRHTPLLNEGNLCLVAH